ncbi:MAG: hypothetical protein ABI193_14305 [Minicystis sp.]
MKADRSSRGSKGRFALATATLALTGCGGPDLELAATQSLRWAERVDDAAALSVLLYAGSTHAHTTEDMIALAIPAVGAALTADCFPAPKVENTRVTFDFKQCAGQEGNHGVRALDGKIVASYGINDLTADTLSLTLTTTQLSLNGTSGDLSLAAGNVFPASTWSSKPENELAFHLTDQHPPASSTESRDALLTFSGDYQVPEGCDAGTKSPPRIGAATGLARVDDGEAWTISAAGYVRCGERCPQAGTIRAQREIAIEVLLDGSASAKATNLGTGESVSVALDCTP